MGVGLQMDSGGICHFCIYKKHPFKNDWLNHRTTLGLEPPSICEWPQDSILWLPHHMITYFPVLLVASGKFATSTADCAPRFFQLVERINLLLSFVQGFISCLLCSSLQVFRHIFAWECSMLWVCCLGARWIPCLFCMGISSRSYLTFWDIGLQGIVFVEMCTKK